MNRTRGFVNLNRFKSSKAIKRLNKAGHGKHTKLRDGKTCLATVSGRSAAR
ncbi:hypothetical protein ACFLVW_06360 [Chloroflexota bacterium]